MDKVNPARSILLLAGIALGVAPLLVPNSSAWPGGALRAGGFVLLGLAAALEAPRIFSGDRLSRTDIFLVVALPFYILSVGNAMVLTSGDNLATRTIAPQLWKHRSLDMGDMPLYRQRPLHYSAVPVGSRILPAFPLGTGLLAIPYEGLALAVSPDIETDDRLGIREKHFSALLMSGAAVLFFLALRRGFSERVALATTALFGLGTPVFSSASQAMWSVTGEVFLLCLALFLLFPEPSNPSRALGAGLALGGAFLCRPTALVAGAFLLVLLARRSRREATLFGTAMVASVVLQAVWLHSLYGHVLGGYGLLNPGARWRGSSLLLGLAGTLVSPSRGLLLYCPFLLLLPLGIAALRRDDRLRDWWFASLGTTLGVLAIVSGYDKWWGGQSLGPRLLTETAPFLALLVAPIFVRWNELGRMRIVVTATAGFAIATQLSSAYNLRVLDWNEEIDEHLPRLWSFRQSQLLVAWTPGFLRNALRIEDESLLGSVDDPSEGAVVSGTILVRGWARMPGEEVEVTFELDGEKRQPTSFRRVRRPDVCQVFPSLAPCDHAGYEALFEPKQGDAGPHQLVAIFATTDRQRHFPVRRFTWAR